MHERIRTVDLVRLVDVVKWLEVKVESDTDNWIGF